ncbi:MAG: ParB/RepB/Spo0J family partition protein [Defluviitaleaceae bacterium]|nr:ParB/RepB/Spo0J family partition protein [Defluviitaleaceae bacterium]
MQEEKRYEAIKLLKPHPKNEEFFDNITGDAWDEFLESVKARGITNAITINKDNVIISGHQRVRACNELNITSIPCFTKAYEETDELLKEDAMLLDLIDSNLKQRVPGNHNPIKLARCIKELERLYGVRQGSAGNIGTKRHNKDPEGNYFTQSDIAKKVNLEERQYSNYKRLLNLIPELQELVENESLSATTAYKIYARLPAETQSEFFDYIGTDKIITMTGIESERVLEEWQLEKEQLLDGFKEKETEYQDEIADLIQQLADEDTKKPFMIQSKDLLLECTNRLGHEFNTLKEALPFKVDEQTVQSIIRSLNACKLFIDKLLYEIDNPPDDENEEDIVMTEPDSREFRVITFQTHYVFKDNKEDSLSVAFMMDVDRPRRIYYKELEMDLGLCGDKYNLLVPFDNYKNFMIDYEIDKHDEIKQQVHELKNNLPEVSNV